MTPQRRSDDFTTRNKITLRDGVLILLGALGMYGTQLATQYGMRSDIRDLATKFTAANDSMQSQINEWRGETKLNRIDIQTERDEISELKGIMIGAGVKGVSSVKR